MLPSRLIGFAFCVLVSHALAAPAPVASAIRVPPGFDVVQIAAPPLISFPIMANFDDRGRLFVAENAGVNLNDKQLDEKTPNHVRLLEDTDGDGIFDRSTIFADKMTFPQGALWHDGGLYVASPPSIWRLEDNDGDGRAEVRKEPVKGFKYTGNAADVHGPFLHPSGRIYWCHGRKGHEVKQRDGTLVAKGLAARIWSMRPDGSDIQVHASGGMDNPAEVTFNQEGDVFGTVNIFLRGPRADALLHWVHGAAFPHHETAIAELKKTGPLLDAMALIGHVAPSGLTLLRSENWEADLRGNLVWAEFNTRRIMRATLELRGASFRATPAVFASTTQDGVHFTDVFEDADGSLIVVDTGAWFRQGCPTSGVARPDISGGIYRIRRTGTPTVADPRGLKLNWAALTPSVLVELLGDSRPGVRDRAVAELAARGAGAIQPLTVALRDGGYLIRSNAVWALTRIATPEAVAAARPALMDRDARVRQAAAQSAFVTQDRGAFDSLVRLLADEAAAVRREAARALGRLGRPDAVASLGKAIARADNDPVLSHALIFALLEIASAAETRQLLASADPLVRRAGLIVLDQLPDGALEPEVVFAGLRSDHASLRSTALQIVLGRPQWSQAVAAHLEWLFGQPATGARDEVAGALLAKFLSAEPVRDWVARRIESVPPVLVFGAIAATPSHWDARWREWLRRGLRSSEHIMAQAALRAITTHRQRDFAAELREVAADQTRPAAFRVAALQAAAGTDRALDAEGFGIVLQPFVTGGSPDARLQAATVIGNSKLTREQLITLAAVLPSAGPMELPQLLGAFQKGPADPEVGDLLLAKLKAAPARFALHSGVVQPTFNRYPNGPAKVAPLVAEVLNQAAAQSVRVTELEKFAVKGDAARGEKAFRGGAGACVSCHRVGDVGAKIGPDLSRLGAIREVRDIVESIAFPDASIAQGYEMFRVETKTAQTLVGTLARETPEQIVVVTADGKENPVPRASVARLEPLPNSLMPPGLDRALDPQTFADLVVYLKTRR